MGLLGGMMRRGIVATPEQEEEQRRLEAIFGRNPIGPPTAQPMPTAPQGKPQRAPGFWQGGDGFSLRDGAAGALAVIGDALSRRGGGQGGAVEMLGGGRMNALKMAQEAQAAQAERVQGLEDYEARKQVDQRYREAPSPYRHQDNAGNVWEYDPATGTNKRIFTDTVPKMYVQGDQALQIPNPYAQASGRPEIGAVMADPRKAGTAQPTGGAGLEAAPRRFRSAPPQTLSNGGMTSGRRTVAGNALVGGVKNSRHLDGTAVDYDGPDLPALLREVRGLPGHRRSFIHRGHVHGEGDWDVPYFGKRGTVGRK